MMLQQDLETIKTIVQWVVGLMAPIVTAMSLAIYTLWKRNISLQDAHAAEMKEVWKTTLDAFVEQSRVVERMSSKIGGGDGRP